jgi:hypothetical protein
VLKEHRSVIVALVDSRSARIYRYARGMLDGLPEMSRSADEHPAPGIAPGPERRGKSFPAPRSAPGTEQARGHGSPATHCRRASSVAPRCRPR